MNPGRELDALIAKKVFGLVQSEVHPHLWRDPSRFDNASMPLLNYSTYISDAWTVVEKFRSARPEYVLLWPQTSPGGNCRCVITFGIYRETYKEFMEKGYDEIIGDTGPHAICLAALKAVEGK